MSSVTVIGGRERGSGSATVFSSGLSTSPTVVEGGSSDGRFDREVNEDTADAREGFVVQEQSFEGPRFSRCVRTWLPGEGDDEDDDEDCDEDEKKRRRRRRRRRGRGRNRGRGH